MPFPLSANSRFVPIPDDLRETLAPAQVALFEWTDYFFHWARADALQIDNRTIEPIAPGVFRVRWENALGLSSLTPMRQNEPLEAPMWVEVLSPKFPTPQQHLAFLRDLLERLFAISPHLIWHTRGDTARGAAASNRPISAPETLDWALRFGDELGQTLAIIARSPARDWVCQNVEVSPAQTSELSAAQLALLARDGARWQHVAQRATQHTGYRALLGGLAPARVPQTRKNQSFDFADNQHSLAFTGALEGALIQAQQTQWWRALNANQRAQIEELTRALSGFGAQLRPFVGTPRARWLPRAATYRALWQLQQSWRGAGAPLWENAARLARVRDIATLWELHVFFDLIARIERVFSQSAQLEAHWDAERGLLAPSRARFGDYTLTFNGPASSYSTPLRPDYLWTRGAVAIAAFDAKFRFDATGGTGRGADLHKMHAYRDALNVSAAIALHPGAQTTFFDRERGPIARVPLRAILQSEAAGVGLWGLNNK